MAIETIKVFSHIFSVVVDKETEKVLSINQNITDVKGMRKNLETAVDTVKNYESIGFYPMTKPEFIDEVIHNFSDVALSKKDVINESRHQVIEGYIGCVRVFQLPYEYISQVKDMMVGFDVDYDTQSWEIKDIREI